MVMFVIAIYSNEIFSCNLNIQFKDGVSQAVSATLIILIYSSIAYVISLKSI